MKKLFILVMLIFRVTVAECLDCSFITTSIEIEEELHKDTLIMPVHIEAQSNREIEIVTILGEIDKQIRALGVDYKGGSYSVYKNCSWEKDKMKCFGYKGDLFYTFELRNLNIQNDILKILDTAQQKYNLKVSYTISEPFWSVSSKRIKETEEGLKIDIIDKAISFKEILGKKLSKLCDIAEMNFEQSFIPLYKSAIVEMTTSERFQAPQPKQDTQTISVKALLKYRCK